MAKNVFKRVEIKYRLTPAQYENLRERLKPYAHEDEYGLSKITSIYYDTEHFDLARESLEKPVYKEKLRLRCYGTVTNESKVYAELKKKYMGVVYKRRIALSYPEADAYFKRGIYPDTDSQIMKEIDYFVRYYRSLRPTYVEYMRIAMLANDDPELRITFDKDIKVKYDEGCLMHGNGAIPLMDTDDYLMEIKARGAMPLWLTEALSDLKIYPNSFSKYGAATKSHAAVLNEGDLL